MRTSYAVGVDVGGTRIAAGLVERKGRIVKEAKSLTPKTGPFAIVDTIIELAEEVQTSVQPSEVAGIGIGLPAQIDFLKQSVEFCTNLPLAGVDVRALVMTRTRQEVTVDNDGNLAALGEYRWGVGKDSRDFLMITLGTGVGGGMFVDGEPYRGSRGMAGEIGHMVVDLDGPPCPCGGTGHIEAFIGRPALARQGREAARGQSGQAILDEAGGEIDDITAEAVLRAALAGDETALRIMHDAGDVLGRGLVGIVNLLNPHLIAIGGGIGESADFLVDQARAAIDAEALAGRRDVAIVQAELGNDAGVLGAAALAFDEHDSREGLRR
jgi:glucokinase